MKRGSGISSHLPKPIGFDEYMDVRLESDDVRRSPCGGLQLVVRS